MKHLVLLAGVTVLLGTVVSGCSKSDPTLEAAPPPSSNAQPAAAAPNKVRDDGRPLSGRTKRRQ